MAFIVVTVSPQAAVYHVKYILFKKVEIYVIEW